MENVCLFFPSNEFTRICFYTGGRYGTKNKSTSKQDIIFDVYIPISWDEIDLRLAWVCDRIFDILFDKKITGLGKIGSSKSAPLSAPSKYVGYRLIFEFGSPNA